MAKIEKEFIEFIDDYYLENSKHEKPYDIFHKDTAILAYLEHKNLSDVKLPQKYIDVEFFISANHDGNYVVTNDLIAEYQLYYNGEL
jgi:hypothetical protein